MEYYGNTLCISARELVDGGIMTASNYKQLSARKRINVVRSGKGQGRYALVAVDSIPTIYRKMVDKLYPGGDTVRLEGWITSNYRPTKQPLLSSTTVQKQGLTSHKRK